MVPEVDRIVLPACLGSIVCHRIGCGRILPPAQIWSKKISRGSPSACSILPIEIAFQKKLLPKKVNMLIAYFVSFNI